MTEEELRAEFLEYHWDADELIPALDKHMAACAASLLSGLVLQYGKDGNIDLYDPNGDCETLRAFDLREAVLECFAGSRDRQGAHDGKFHGADEVEEVRRCIEVLRSIADELEADIVA